MTGSIGAVTNKSGVTQPVTGVSATGAVGQVNVWSDIVPVPGTTWTLVTPNNDPGWQLVA